MSEPELDLPTLVAHLKALMRELAQTGKEMIEAAPNLSTPLRKLIAVPLDKIDESVDQMVDKLPEDQREKWLRALTAALEETKKHTDLTKWRIERRIQPEGQPRQKHEFRSFCKRKPRW
jgi:hypothetical protein